MQDNVAVSNGVVTGSLKFIKGGIAQSGPLAGDGHFLALKFSADWDGYTSVKVGLEPTKGTGLVEILDDPDKNGVFKIDNKNQKLKVVCKSSTTSKTQTYSLTGLVLE